MVFREGYVSDELTGTIAPIALYWLYGGAYMLMPPLKRYRLHTKREEDEKNIIDLPTVVKGVLFQQLLQAVITHLLFLVSVIISIFFFVFFSFSSCQILFFFLKFNLFFLLCYDC